MALKVVLWGHSFVRRFKDFLTERVIHNAGLDTDKFDINFVGLGGLSLSQRRRLHSKDDELREADIVIIDIGSNDLCNEMYSPEQFALDLMSYSSFLITGLNVKKVVLMQVLYRECVPYQTYNDHVISANVALQTLVGTRSLSIFFWKHSGMWCCENSIFGPDGIHLSKDIGYPKYLRSIRDCVIRVARWSRE